MGTFNAVYLRIFNYWTLYNVFHNRQKEDIRAKIASLDGRIMKLEMQIDMLQSDLIQVNWHGVILDQACIKYFHLKLIAACSITLTTQSQFSGKRPEERAQQKGWN